MLDAVGEAEHDAARGVRRSGDRDAHRAVRDGVPHAVVRAGTDGSVEGAGLGVRAVRARVAQAGHATPPTASSPAAWPSAACASSSSITAAGTSTATCRATSRCSASDTDQPTAALINDLKQRGLLDDTLVIWGGEFGRTVYSQGKLTDDNYGRDHHPRNFSMWMAGGGIKRGMVLGETDDFSYNVVDGSGLMSTTSTRRSCTCWASTTPS